jgi:hypothetical protein
MEAKSKNKYDEELFRAMSELPVLPFYGLVKQNKEDLEEKKQTFIKTGESPTFSYSRADAYNVSAYLDALTIFETKIPDLSDHQTLIELYQRKCVELRKRAQLIEAIQHQNGQLVTSLSKELFTTPKQNADELENEFKAMLKDADTFFEHTKPIDSKKFLAYAKKLLSYYKLNNWRVELYKGSSVKINHGSTTLNPIIRIPKQLQISKSRAARLLTHEIEIHALRTQNGIESPLHLLRKGLDGYLLTEEGLASYFQQQVSAKPRKYASGFWDAWTVALTQTGNFQQTFTTIFNAKLALAEKANKDNALQIAQDAAWRLCLRVYRGIANTNQTGVGFMRDHIYRSGYLEIKEAIETQGKQIIPTLFAGNMGLHHIQKMQKLVISTKKIPELVSKQIIAK